MVELKKIKLHNFLSFEDEEFEFEEGNYLVLGQNNDSDLVESNGSGKSSLFEAVIFAIYGKGDRNYQRYGTNDTYVQLDFIYDGDLYSIIRYYNHYQLKNKIDIIKNGENLVFHTKKQAQDLIDKIFRLSYENFISSVVYKQGLSVRLSLLTPSKRKEYFSRLIDADFDMVEKKVKLDMKVLEHDISEQRKVVERLKNGVSYDEGRLNAMLSFLKGNNEEMDKRKEELQKELIELREKLKLVERGLDKLKREREQKYKEYVSEMAKLQTELKQLKKLENGICPLCRQEVKAVEGIRMRIKLIEKQLKRSFIFIKDFKIENLNKEKKNLESKISKIEKELYSIVQKLLEEKSAKEKFKTLKKTLEEMKKKLKIEEDKLVDKEFEYDRLKMFHNLVKPSGELRTVVLLNYLEVYNSILNNIISNVFPELKEVKLVADDKFQGIVIKGVNYENLSGGEKKRLDLCFQLAFSEFLYYLSNFSVNLIVFDEIVENLDVVAVELFLNYVKELANDGKCVYFITHNNEFKSYFDKVVLVKKENGVSHIERV